MLELIQIGNRWALTNGTSKKNFKDAHELCREINRLNLKLKVKGLHQLPKYFQGLIGYQEPILHEAHVAQLMLSLCY